MRMTTGIFRSRFIATFCHAKEVMTCRRFARPADDIQTGLLMNTDCTYDASVNTEERNTAEFYEAASVGQDRNSLRIDDG